MKNEKLSNGFGINPILWMLIAYINPETKYWVRALQEKEGLKWTERKNLKLSPFRS